MRITRKYLIEFLNKKFEEFEITQYEVYAVEPTRFSIHLLEGGAACLYIRFRVKGESWSHTNHGTFFCFYRIKDLQWYVNNGYEIYLKGDKYSLSNYELDVRKK